MGNRITSEKLTDSQSLCLQIVTVTICVISLIPTLLLLISFILNSSFKQYLLIPVFQLLIAIILHSVYIFFPSNPEGVVCQIQGFFNVAFDLSVLLWTTVIAFFIYIVYHNNFPEEKSRRIVMIIVSIFVWLCPIIFGSIPIIVNDYKINKSRTCWLSNSIFVTTYCVINLVIMLLNFCIMAKLITDIKKDIGKDKTKEEFLAYRWRLWRFIIVQIIVYSPSFIEQVLGLIQGIDKYTMYYWWLIVRESIDALSGLMFVMVYGFNKQTYAEMKDAFCCKKTIEGEISERAGSILLDIENNDQDATSEY